MENEEQGLQKWHRVFDAAKAFVLAGFSLYYAIRAVKPAAGKDQSAQVPKLRDTPFSAQR